MSDFFFDTSALVKRFSRETGTAWVIDLVRPASGQIIYLANITSVEVVSAITRRMRGGHLTMAAAKKALTRFHRSFLRRYVIVEINPPLISRARRARTATQARHYKNRHRKRQRYLMLLFGLLVEANCAAHCITERFTVARRAFEPTQDNF